MTLDVWFREDIKNLVLAIGEAMGTSTGGYDSPELIAAYREGARAGLLALATALGIAAEFAPMKPDLRQRITERGRR